MTTPLRRPVARIVSTRRDGSLVVTLTELGLMIREKGRRTTYGPLPYGKLLLAGARDYIEQKKREKREARKLRRLSR